MKTPLTAASQKVVALALERVRLVERVEEHSRALETIGDILLRLATDLEPELVTAADQARAHRWGGLLSVDEDRRLALYLVSEEPRAASPAHEHLTWQVTACLRGHERHRLYARTARHRTVRPVHEVSLTPGTHLSMLTEQIHSTMVVSDEPTVLLQMCGTDVARLPDLASRTFVAEA